MSAAEPVQPATRERFIARFARLGWTRRSCRGYGLRRTRSRRRIMVAAPSISMRRTCAAAACPARTPAQRRPASRAARRPSRGSGCGSWTRPAARQRALNRRGVAGGLNVCAVLGHPRRSL
jgi:hypothetical protein